MMTWRPVMLTCHAELVPRVAPTGPPRPLPFLAAPFVPAPRLTHSPPPASGLGRMARNFLEAHMPCFQVPC